MSKISKKLVRYIGASMSGNQSVQDEQFVEIRASIDAYTQRALKAIDSRNFEELHNATMDFIEAQDGVGVGDAKGGTGMLGDGEFLGIAMRSMVRRDFPTRNIVLLTQVALREAQGNPMPSTIAEVPLSQIKSS